MWNVWNSLMIAFEESGKIEILDPDLFNILLKYKGNQ
jgi:hypothetical protein